MKVFVIVAVVCFALFLPYHKSVSQKEKELKKTKTNKNTNKILLPENNIWKKMR